MRESEIEKLAALCREDPEKVAAQIESWLQEDGCFATLQISSRAFVERDPNKRKALQALIEAHETVCGGYCLRNALVQEHTATDPLRKLVYRDVLERFMRLWTNLNGIQTTRELKPDGLYFRSTFSAQCVAEQGLPFTAMELFQPTDVGQKCRFVLDVCSEALFNDSGPLIQHLDLKASHEVKAFPVHAQILHWRAISGEDEPELWIRWKGETKLLRRDWTLAARYGSAVQAFATPDRSRRLPLSPGEVALKLRRIALDYDGSSWFMGFLRKRLELRSIDEFRRAKRDVFSHVEDLPRGSGEEGDESESDPFTQAVERASHHAWTASQESPEDAIDREGLAQRLRSQLTQVQRQVLDLKGQGLTDEKIAKQLGLRRETVNRHLHRIKRIAVAIMS